MKSVPRGWFLVGPLLSNWYTVAVASTKLNCLIERKEIVKCMSDITEVFLHQALQCARHEAPQEVEAMHRWTDGLQGRLDINVLP
ncbi:MAG: hypothetical protein ABI599_16525, partial [Flavobacteriales bacterium]